jgi:hypothetical protein
MRQRAKSSKSRACLPHHFRNRPPDVPDLKSNTGQTLAGQILICPGDSLPRLFYSYAAVSPLIPGPGCEICIHPATSSCTSTANRRYRILLHCASFLFLPDFITTRSPQPPLWPVRPRNFSNSRVEGSHIAQLSLSSARLRLFQPSRVSLKVPLRAMSVSFS